MRQGTLLLWVLRLANDGQAGRAFAYARTHMIEQLRYGHSSATSVAAGVQAQMQGG